MNTSLKHFSRAILAVAAVASFYTQADQKISDDLVIQGSLCVGLDCSVGENFNYDTIRMKENNLRIRFIDTSATSSFPTRDWQITANENTNGGKNAFFIENTDAPTIPFYIDESAPNYGIYIGAGDRVGFSTSTPFMQLHTVAGNSPTLRLEQTTAGGFAAQAWDVGGNETNFFVRDYTGGSKLPLRITAGAPNGSIHVAANGYFGLRTITPDGYLDVAHPLDANDHALLVHTNGDVGVNIYNGFQPGGIFDVQTSAGTSRFRVQNDGKVAIGLGTSGTANGVFDVQINGTSHFTVDAEGDIGIGNSTPTGRFHLKSTDGTKSYMSVGATGNIGLGIEAPQSFYGATPTVQLTDSDGVHTMLMITSTTDITTASIGFGSNAVNRWLLSSRSSYDGTTSSNPAIDRLAFMNKTASEVFTLHQDGTIESFTGAKLTSGGVWQDASSRALKQDIADISLDEAIDALHNLNPVTYKYKNEPDEVYAGFIAEDVPDIVATKNRKNLAPMDIVAILTKITQAQEATIKAMSKDIEQLKSSASQDK